MWDMTEYRQTKYLYFIFFDGMKCVLDGNSRFKNIMFNENTKTSWEKGLFFFDQAVHVFNKLIIETKTYSLYLNYWTLHNIESSKFL